MKRFIYLSAALIIIAIATISWSAKSIPFSAMIPGIGDKAADIILENPDGKEIALSDLEGHVVLLDFWASWCGPCRRKNPEIVALYNKYKDSKFIKGTKGFEVYSVSLDKDKNRWVQAIEKDSLAWDAHVSDLRGWSSEGGKKYGIRSIPTTYLIDEEGYIIGRNLGTGAITMELDKRLKK